MPTCSNCGGIFDDTFQFCPYCGNPKPKPRAQIQVDGMSREPTSSLDCPRCHRVDNVSRVSAIVQGGTHQINGQIPVPYTTHDSEGWHSRTSSESFHATQQSTIARKLMAPEQPKKESSGWCSCAFILWPLALIVFMVGTDALFSGRSLSSSERTGMSFAMILPVLFVIGTWMAGNYINKPFTAKHAVSIAAWERSVSKWRELYYCSRDGCIFIPGEGSTFDVSDLNRAIDWHPIKNSNSFPPKIF